MASVAAAPKGSAVDDAAPVMAPCGKKCMGPCCLPSSGLPVYGFAPKALPMKSQSSVSRDASCTSLSSLGSTAFERIDSDLSSGSESSDEAEEVKRSFLDALMTNMWDERVEEGLFRYSVTGTESKVILGEMGFVAQFNEGRHMKKRATEFRMDAVLQPFDMAKFNFTKMGQREALMAFQPVPAASPIAAKGANSASPPMAPVVLTVVEGTNPGNAVIDGANVVANDSLAGSPNIIAINVSPIDYGHVLLIPRILDHLPQRIDPESLLLALQLAAEVHNPCFRLGYNSLGAYATVNHLHFQGYYLRTPSAIERASTAPVWGPQEGTQGLAICELQGYPVRGLCFEVGDSREEAAQVLGNLCQRLQERNQPFNLFIASCGSRVFFYPQCYAERQAKGEVEQDLLDTGVNPAVFEISGHMIMKHQSDFESITEELAVRLLAAVSLSAEAFGEIKGLCIEIAEGLKA